MGKLILAAPLLLAAAAASAEAPRVATDVPPVHSLVARVMGEPRRPGADPAPGRLAAQLRHAPLRRGKASGGGPGVLGRRGPDPLVRPRRRVAGAGRDRGRADRGGGHQLLPMREGATFEPHEHAGDTRRGARAERRGASTARAASTRTPGSIPRTPSSGSTRSRRRSARPTRRTPAPTPTNAAAAKAEIDALSAQLDAAARAGARPAVRRLPRRLPLFRAALRHRGRRGDRARRRLRSRAPRAWRRSAARSPSSARSASSPSRSSSRP